MSNTISTSFSGIVYSGTTAQEDYILQVVEAAGGVVATGAYTFNTSAGINSFPIDPQASMAVNNTAYGYGALENNESGDSNVAVGVNSLNSNTTGSSNTAVGYFSSYNVTGAYNTSVGQFSLANNIYDVIDNGSVNTAVGYAALRSNGSGSNNTAIGGSALNANNGNQNTAIGVGALTFNVNTGDTNNTAVGYQALYDCNGTYNVAIGSNALNNSEGTQNVAIGVDTLLNTVGSYNTVVGSNSYVVTGGAAVPEGSYNTVLGSGCGNTYLGANESTASNNILIGYSTDILIDDDNTGKHQIVIGQGTSVATSLTSAGDNTITIGSVESGSMYCDFTSSAPVWKSSSGGGPSLIQFLKYDSGNLSTQDALLIDLVPSFDQTTTAGDVLLQFTSSIYSITFTGSVLCSLYVDGVASDQSFYFGISIGSDELQVSFTFKKTLAAGDHSFAVKASATANINTSTNSYYQYTLSQIV